MQGESGHLEENHGVCRRMAAMGGGSGRERLGRGAGESRDAVGSVRRPDEDLGGSMDSVPGIFPLTDCRPSAVRVSSFSSCVFTPSQRA